MSTETGYFQGFEHRASIRSWLYRIATTRCLNFHRLAQRRPSTDLKGGRVPEANGRGEVLWLEPYPDVLLDKLTDDAPGPDAQYELHESVSLAFVAALQLLPPRQRAALILRDVLGFRATEVAGILGTSEESVTSALKRARAGLTEQTAGHYPDPPTQEQAEVARRFAKAWEAADIEAIAALLAEDVAVTMPPLPLEYRGRPLALQFLIDVAFRDHRKYRLVPTSANRSPAFAAYVVDVAGEHAHAIGLLAIAIANGKVATITRFDVGLLARFGLPRSISLG